MHRSTRLTTLVVAGLLSLAACGDDAGTATGGATGATGTASAAADELAAVQEAGVLRVGTEGTYSPFSFHDPSTDDLTGYDVEVVTEVAERMGVEVEFSEVTWDGIFAGLEADRYDVVANQVSLTPERQDTYTFSQPYTVSTGVIVTQADDTSVTSLADVAGKTSAQSSTSNWAQVATDNGATVQSVEGFTQAVALVEQGRVDLTINDDLAVLNYLATTGDAGVKIAAETEDTTEQALAFRKGSDLAAAADEALDAMRADGTLAQISEKYFGEDVSGAATGASASATAGASASASSPTE